MAIDLKQYLPTNLRNEIWSDFMDALSEEFTYLKQTLIDPKKDYFNIREQNDADQLVEIAKTFGLVPDRSIDSSVAYMKLLDKLINYKIKYKTSYIGYDFIFKAINTLGQVYNLYFENGALLRGINFPNIITELNAISDYSLPFKSILPEFYYAPVSETISTIDAGWTLDDSSVIATLDESYIIHKTNYLAIEYSPFNLITENSIEYYMTSLYMNYLLNGVLYNKKCTEYPEIGFQVNAVIDESGYFDNLSDSTYTIPDLKLNCATAQSNFLNEYSFVQLDIPTGSEGNMDLDLPTPWVLDSISPTIFQDTLQDTFNKVCIGNFKKGVASKDYPDLNKNIVLYWPFDENTGTIFYDKTVNAYNGVISGSYTWENKIIGSCIKYDGSTVKAVANNISLLNYDYTLSFWINAGAQLNTTSYIIDFDLIKVWYDSSLSRLNVGVGGVSQAYDLTLNNTDKLISIKIDWDTLKIVTVYVNGIAYNTTIDISGLTSIDGIYNFYLGCDSTSSNFFKGYIDEVRFYSRLLTSDEILYLYESKLGEISKLGNELLVDTSAIENIYDNTDWYIITAKVRLYDYSSFDYSELSEEIIFNEIGIKDINNNVVVYCTLPNVKVTKNYYLSFNICIKK